MSSTTTVRFRYDADRWKSVQAKAAAEGRTASVIMRKLLDGWLDDDTTLTAQEIQHLLKSVAMTL